MWITAAVAVAAGVIVAGVLRAALRRLGLQAERTRWRADDAVLGLLRSVLPWGVAIAGVWVAALRMPLSAGYRNDVDHALAGAVVVVLTFAAARAAAELVGAGALSRSGTSGSATIFVNIARIVVVMIGTLVLLDSLGIAIAPLLTALGVGGLAVALALQDTLSNLFAGVHILASRKVVPGDFIQLDNGMEGYVVDTNWRNTTVRQLPGNIVIVPNATLASSVVTNYHQPDQETAVSVPVGVSYDSDLDHVERVTREVGLEVMGEVEGAVPTHEPLIRYNAFGDSSIDFSVILRATEITSQHLIRHEFIKRLHRRYQAEAIEIPFPVRTVVPARSAPLAIQQVNGAPANIPESTTASAGSQR
jgi:small-conductance mechanosensitive channel